MILTIVIVVKKRKEPHIFIPFALAFGSARSAVQAPVRPARLGRLIGLKICPVPPPVTLRVWPKRWNRLNPTVCSPDAPAAGGWGAPIPLFQIARERNLINYTGAPLLSRDQWTAGYKGSCTFWDWAESQVFCAFLTGESCRYYNSGARFGSDSDNQT